MKNSQRDIYFYDLHIHPSKTAAVSPSLKSVVEVLKSCVDGGHASIGILKNTETLTIRDVQINTKHNVAVLFIAHADPSAPNAVYSNPDDGTSRVVPKRRGEAGDFGAHVLLSLSPEPTRPDTYLAIVERVAGVGRTYVERVMNSVIRVQCKKNNSTFECADRTGKRNRAGSPLMVGFRPILRFFGHPSDSFAQDLEAGKFSGLTLVQTNLHTPVGGRAYLTSEESRLKVKVNRKKLVPKLWQDLRAALFATSRDWNEARIRFTGPDGRPREVSIDTKTGNVMDDMYVKTQRISGIYPLLDASSDEIVTHFADLMIQELIAYRSENT